MLAGVFFLVNEMHKLGFWVGGAIEGGLGPELFSIYIRSDEKLNEENQQNIPILNVPFPFRVPDSAGKPGLGCGREIEREMVGNGGYIPPGRVHTLPT